MAFLHLISSKMIHNFAHNRLHCFHLLYGHTDSKSAIISLNSLLYFGLDFSQSFGAFVNHSDGFVRSIPKDKRFYH